MSTPRNGGLGRWTRGVLRALVIAAAGGVIAAQSIVVPNTFINGTVADAPQVNANFAALANGALNRTGGTMTGTLNSRDVIPTADATYDLGTALLRFRDGFLSRNVTIGGTLGVTGAVTLTNAATTINTVPYSWPGTQGANGAVLRNNGSGTLAWSQSGWTTVTTTAVGTQNDFAPGLAGNTILRCNNATILTITGFAGGVDGQRVVVESINAQVDLEHQSVSSTTAADRFINYATSSWTSLAAGVGTAEYVYDGTTARWRMVRHEQGAPIVLVVPGQYPLTFFGTVGGAGTASSITQVQFYLKGKQLSIDITESGFTITAGPAATITVRIPGPQLTGYTAQAANFYPAVVRGSDNGGPTLLGMVGTGISNTLSLYSSVGGGGWANSLGATAFQFSVTIPIS